MAKQPHVDNEATPTPSPLVSGTTPPPAAWSRRRFTRAGLGASGGVIMTLASQPGMACVCKSPSGSLSNGLNSRNPTSCSGGKKPETWATSTLPCSDTTLFSSVFDCSSGAASGYRNLSFRSLLTGGQNYADGTPVPDKPTADQQKLTVYSAAIDAGNADIGKHLTAAYLNAAYTSGYGTKPTQFLDIGKVKAIWSEWALTGGRAGGYYTPQANTRWDATQIKSYLRSTMI